MGQANSTPPRSAIEAAREMLARLVDGNLAIPLNLLGTPADHPDFIVSPETLPFVFAMRGDRDWKHAPGSGTTRVSPLVQQVWRVLERKGVLSADELKDEIGRELTEAAALRALYELWGAMRVVPLYQVGGESTLWEALQTRQSKALNAGTNMSQVTALSVLVSLYLESAVAATSEEVEVFLSPLTSRSKVREAVRGLTATRQLALLPMERETLLHVEGSLPDFEEPMPLRGAGADEVEEATGVEGRRAFHRLSGPATSGPKRTPAGGHGLSIKGARPKLPDTISVWPRPAVEPQAEPAVASGITAHARGEGKKVRPRTSGTVPPQAANRGADGTRGAGTPAEASGAVGSGAGGRAASGIRSFAGPGASPRRERTPARPPWKDKGKPGFAKSLAAKGDKARWPRERASGPRSQDDRDAGRMTQSEAPNASPARASQGKAGALPARRAPGSFGAGFEARGDFKAAERTSRPRSQESGDAASGPSPAGRPGAGDTGSRGEFKPRGDFKAGGSKPGSGFKPRGDFKDFKARKPGDERRRSPFTPARSGPSPSESRRGSGSESRGQGARPPYAGSGEARGDRPPRKGFAPRPGGEFRQPWKDGAGKPSRPARAFGAAQGRSSGPRGPFSPRAASTGGPGSERSAPRPAPRAGGSGTDFKPRSFQRPGSGSGLGPGSASRSSFPARSGPRPDRRGPAGESGDRPGGGFKGGGKSGGAGGFKRPLPAAGFKPTAGARERGSGGPAQDGDRAGARPSGPGGRPPFARKAGSAASSGGFAKRSRPSSGPAEAGRPPKRSFASSRTGGATGGAPGGARPPFRKKRKPE